MSDRTVVRTVVQTRAAVRNVGPTGRSAYESYLATTDDAPPLSEEAWSAGTGGPGGTVDAAAVAAIIHAAAAKSPPVDADEFTAADSAATWGLKKITWAAIKSALKTYFDTLYQAAGVTWSTLAGKPSTFPPSTHAHAWSDLTSGVPTTFPPTPPTELTEASVDGTTGFIDLGNGEYIFRGGYSATDYPARPSSSAVDRIVITNIGPGNVQLCTASGTPVVTLAPGCEGTLRRSEIAAQYWIVTPAYFGTLALTSDFSSASVNHANTATTADSATTAGSTANLTNGTISGTVAFGTGAAAALRTAAKVPASDPTGITGADAVTNMVSLTAAEYSALGSKDATTLYVVI